MNENQMAILREALGLEPDADFDEVVMEACRIRGSRQRMAQLLLEAAYPRRGSSEDSMTLQEFGQRVRRKFGLEELVS